MDESGHDGDSVRVVGLCGSLRPGSRTRMALAAALEGAAELGAETRLLDLREYDLIFCDGKEDESRYPADVERLRRDIREADGLLLGTPEYHGSLSGVLKNALDLMGFAEIEGKMLGLVGVAGGAIGAFNALSALRGIGRALHAWVVPHQASIPHAAQAFDTDGRPTNPAIERRLRAVGRQVARFALLHNSPHAREFLAAWESAPENPGAAK